MADVTFHPGPGSATNLDPRRAADALLLKIALEGKDFQRARQEVENSQAATPDSPSANQNQAPVVEGSPPDRGLGTSSFALSIEIDRLSIMVQTEVQTGATVATVSLTHARIDLIHTERVATSPKRDPLAFDLDGSGPRTTGSNGAQPFDLDGDGRTEPTSFAMGRTAFLALDRDGNGRIDSGLELFGDQHGAVDGYEELAKFDANGDQRIDGADPVYGNLQLLFGDGRLTPLSSEGIQSIALAAAASEGTTSGGDDIFRRATASLEDGGLIATYALGLNRFEALA